MQGEPQDVNEQFRIFLREKKNELNISGNELDKMIFGKKNSYTSNFETGKTQMTLETFGKFLDMLDYEIKFVKKT